MLKALLNLYDASRIAGTDLPQCRFPENRIFGEDWLLRVMLEQWQRDPPRDTCLDFLPFPKQARVYSEAQLPTPFAERPKSDLKGDRRPHVDGIVGDFEFEADTATGVRLCPDWQYLAVFEAKMSSGLSKGPQDARGYNQVSRAAACMVHAMLEAGPTKGRAHLIVLYPHGEIDPERYVGDRIARGIDERIALACSPEYEDPAPRFQDEWESVLSRIQVHFVTWECVLDDLAADTGSPPKDLNEFYRLCKQFNP